MTIEFIKELLKEETNHCFSETWYDRVSIKLQNNMTQNNPEEYGYVYFVRIIGTSKVKIGCAKNLMNRILSFRTLLTDQISLDGFIYCNNFKEIESEIHKNNKSNNYSLEWFLLSQNECERIINDNKGKIIYCKITSKLLIEAGNIINETERTLIRNYNSGIDEILKSEILLFFESKGFNEFKATATDIKEKLFNSEIRINKRVISSFLQRRGCFSVNERYHPFNNFELPKIPGRAFLLKKELFV